MLSAILLTACSADSKPSVEQSKNNLEKQPNIEQTPPKEPDTIVATFKHILADTSDDRSVFTSDALPMTGKLLIIDNCLLIQTGDINDPIYYQPVLSDMLYAWDEQRKVLIHKQFVWNDEQKISIPDDKNNKEYLIGREIYIVGIDIDNDDEYREKFNIPKCSVKSKLWYAN